MTVRFSHALLLFLLSLTWSLHRARADTGIPTVAEELARFRREPKAFLNAKPTRYRPGGTLWQPQRLTPFGAKLELRKQLISPVLPPPLAEPSPSDDASQVAEITVTRAEELDLLRKAQVPLAPWSGDYWGVYKGGLAKRYADPAFPNKREWKDNYDYLVSRLDEDDPVALLSPAEKYDLLVGDPYWSLTRRMQEEGWLYYRGPRTVPTWVGYCHGWAAAAYSVKRPQKKVDALAADGTMIPFYPDDIKALETVLWADYVMTNPIHFTGARCETSKPAQDANGRILDPGCFDSNPATWHLAVVNRVGVGKSSMTFDASLDEEVWNQPIHSYEISYFNPQTLLPVDDLASATIPIGKFTNDKFRRYRSWRARSVVGIAMALTYIDEIKPTNKPVDAESDDERVTVRYLYDLELDGSGVVIGGEWYKNMHPDFLWRPLDGARPRGGELPDARIVDRLNARSRGP